MESIGKYKVETLIEQGRFGTIYRCLDTLFDRRVAIKVFSVKDDVIEAFISPPDPMDKENKNFNVSPTEVEVKKYLRSRFVDEAKILARLNNIHIIDCFEFGKTDDDTPYYVMPYVGTDLRGLLGQDVHDRILLTDKKIDNPPKTLEISFAINLMSQVLTGVSEIHEADIVHRDIKPNNILLDGDTVKIIDFGIALESDANIVSFTQETFVNRYYASPEQWGTSTKHLQKSSDVYSLGVLFYRMVTGAVPDIMRFEPPHVECSGLGRALSDLIMKAIEHNPENRFQNAGEMLVALRDALISGYLNDESTASASINEKDMMRDENWVGNRADTSHHYRDDDTKMIMPIIDDESTMVGSIANDKNDHVKVNRQGDASLEPREEAVGEVSHQNSAFEVGPAPNNDEIKMSSSGPRMFSPSRAEAVKEHEYKNPFLTAVFPNAVKPKQQGSFIVYIHIESALFKVEKHAQENQELIGGEIEKKSVSESVNLTKDTLFHVSLDFPDLTLVQDNGYVLWSIGKNRKEMDQVVFPFLVSENIQEGVKGQITIFRDGIVHGKIEIDMPINTSGQHFLDKTQSAPLQKYKTIFASYSHLDTPVMSHFKRNAKDEGNKMLVDVYDLRSGENWNDRLLEMIDESDVFQLFWSNHSSTSEYCNQEWQHALKLCESRERFIQPVWWEKPMARPPEELNHLHFAKVALPAKMTLMSKISSFFRS